MNTAYTKTKTMTGTNICNINNKAAEPVGIGRVSTGRKNRVLYNVVFFVVAALSVLPLTDSFFIVRSAVILVAFFTVSLTQDWHIDRGVLNLAFTLILLPVLPVITVLITEGNPDTDLVMHETMRLLFCAALILTASKLRVSFASVYTAAAVMILINFAIQILQYNGYEQIFDFIRGYYLTDTEGWTHMEMAKYKGIEFRSGSIFINPNVYVIIPLLSLCVFFRRDKEKPGIINNILILCTVASAIMTGARTVTVVMFIIMIIYYFGYASVKSRLIFIAAVVSVAALMGGYLLENSRAFNGSSEGSSLEVKLRGFIWFWQTTDELPAYWLTGALGSHTALTVDSEWGHIYTWYGIAGVLWYINYNRLIYKHIAADPSLRFYAICVTVVSVLTAFSTTVMLCMPVYTFVCAVLLSATGEPGETGMKATGTLETAGAGVKSTATRS